jgi:drug/metabolite transporter (DMT)-like permease
MPISAQWTANVAFAVLVSASYLCYALAFRDLGSSVQWTLRYFVSVLTHPLFLAGLVLSFGSTFARLVLFQVAGMSRTVLLSELSVVMMLVASLIVFREQVGVREALGGLLILAGIALVGR